MGISGGGTITFTTAALDERVKAAVVSGAFCTYRDSIFSRSHCIDNYIPGILRWFETADLTGLIAPRYLFVEAGSQDNIFPRPGVEEALQNARKVYKHWERPTISPTPTSTPDISSTASRRSAHWPGGYDPQIATITLQHTLKNRSGGGKGDWLRSERSEDAGPLSALLCLPPPLWGRVGVGGSQAL